MQRSKNTHTYYAVLIGINSYQQKPLKGCVRDVQSIQRFLAASSKQPLIMTVLTAEEQSEVGSVGNSNDLALRPTHGNVVEALEKIIRNARSGDFVYIHFSGHGTRSAPESEFSNQSTGDLALVLLDKETGSGTRYLWGTRLANLVNAMVQVGVQVTMVLDCCFSASVYRWDDLDSRYLPYTHEVHVGPDSCPEETSKPSPETKTLQKHGASESRDISMLPNWLMNPDGYTIIVACGPDEEAREPAIDGEKHGALSYCLLKALNEFGNQVKRHKDFYDHLRVNLKQLVGYQQTPVLFGNGNLGFFGPIAIDRSLPYTPVVVNKDGSIELQVGEAHGVANGDEFYLRPMSSTVASDSSRGPCVAAVVIQVKAFTSIVKPMDTPSAPLRTGCTGTPVTTAILRSFSVRLHADLPYPDRWPEILQSHSLDSRSGACHPSDSFRLTMDDNEYVILDSSNQKIDGVPRMPLETTAPARVVTVLQHLAKYQMVKSLSNSKPVGSFAKSFNIKLRSQWGESLREDCFFEVQQDAAHTVKLTFELKNTGCQKIYAYILNLNPKWGVTNIYFKTHEAAAVKDISEGYSGTIIRRLRIEIPSTLADQGYRHCDDIIKVFVTSQPTSFDILELPRLGELFDKTTDQSDTPRGEDLVKSLVEDQWMTFNYPIRTLLNHNK
ncbi:caspase domain-containing protein [Hypoxylon rubiginosum]|uniref:Caspase domain-containing protein n=1 Tax=Hypoxylon rubiginosum TaxID=110542 RepID=A0ACC0CL65_9PEZI|nr:caspase domain-containing protein [Hypoxylon rubiginosum]